MHLSVIIVNFNVKYFLEQCLCSVLKACINIDAEIIVVDNASADGSREYLEPRFKNVRFIWNSSNIGFAKANNQAASQAKGEFVLFLNPDTLVPEDCFEKCIAFFKTNSQAGGLGIRMIDGTGHFLKESKRAFPSPLTSLFKLTGLSYLFPRSKIFAKYHLGHLKENENHEVDVLAGAFMIIPKKVLNEIGLFDELFFMYGEDVDLSYRIQRAGYKNYYFAESTIIHFKGESTKRGSLNYVRMFYQAMRLFVKKHYSAGEADAYAFLIQIAIIVRAAFSVALNSLKFIGLPMLDGIVILTSFWIVKYIWSISVRQEVDYSPNVLLIAFPVFCIIFLVAAFYSGLYDKGYKQSQLIRSTIIASLVLLSGYGLLPETFRFSRGILVFGIIMAFIIMNLLRQLFIKWRLLEPVPEQLQTIVVAGEQDFIAITTLMQNAGMTERVLGRVNYDESENSNSLGNIQQLSALIKKYQVKEVIFCENGLSYKEIFNQVERLSKNVNTKFHSSKSESIIGSNSKDTAGDYVTGKKIYKIELPINRRNKRLFDILISILFALSFPIHVILLKKPIRFFKNIIAVLTGKKTWVGYTKESTVLPYLKQSVISNTSLPALLNELPAQSLFKLDEWYATSYSMIVDIQKLIRGYKYLSY